MGREEEDVGREEEEEEGCRGIKRTGKEPMAMGQCGGR